MINNYVQYEYQPCHLIHSFDDENKSNLYLGDVSSAMDMDFILNSNIKTGTLFLLPSCHSRSSHGSSLLQTITKHHSYCILSPRSQELEPY